MILPAQWKNLILNHLRALHWRKVMSKRYERVNTGCSRACTPEQRRINAPESLCKCTTSDRDDFSLRCVGEWGRDKVTFLERYMNITFPGMKNKWHDKLAYVEICSGPGLNISRHDGAEFAGSPVKALHSKGAEYINKFIFVDYDSEVVKTLQDRISSSSIEVPLKIKQKVVVENGDYNKADELVSTILKHIPRGCLIVMFIDPTDFSVPFETIRKLSQIGKVDFIINLANSTDFGRGNNWKAPVEKPESNVAQKYISALGSNDLFSQSAYKEAVERSDAQRAKKLLSEAYKESFKQIGYTEFDEQKIEHYYHLFFASRHKLGKKFWLEACQKDSNGQKSLFSYQDESEH